ncbi:hypothetical protein Tco_1274925 [Tanacetum coccineum]
MASQILVTTSEKLVTASEVADLKNPLEDSAGRRFLALGWLWEKIHVTWAHLEKKRTRLRTYTKSLEDLCIDGVVGIKRRRRDVSSDSVRNFTTASGRGRLKEDLESSTWRWR